MMDRPDRTQFNPPAAGWETPGEAPEFPLGEIHVWRVQLSAPPPRVSSYLSLLDEDERRRAGRLLTPGHGDAFILARGALRQLLGIYLGRPPAGIQLAYTPHGKPFVAGDGPPVRFNVSHSGDLALLGFRLGAELGVDVERPRPAVDIDGLARRFFTPGESAALQALAVDQRRAAFFTCWTRKEAYLKAIGRGIAAGVASVEAFTGPAAPPALRRPDGSPMPGWQLFDLDPGPGYRAALAAEGPVTRLRCLDFPV